MTAPDESLSFNDVAGGDHWFSVGLLIEVQGVLAGHGYDVELALLMVGLYQVLYRNDRELSSVSASRCRGDL